MSKSCEQWVKPCFAYTLHTEKTLLVFPNIVKVHLRFLTITLTTKDETDETTLPAHCQMVNY